MSAVDQGKALERTSLASPGNRGGIIPLWVGLLLIVAAAVGFRFHNITEVLVQGRFYFVDADCYSRMSRAKIISASPGTIIRHQSFENWPDGVDSHATAPMDYAIVALERVFMRIWPATGRWAVLRQSTLDLAGALISPILGVGLCVFLWIWARGIRFDDGTGIPAWWCVPALAVISPPLVHATVFGRPDHQSLLVLFLAGALCAEQRLQQRSSHSWALSGGLAWGMAAWVSLYEPLILLGAVILVGALFWRESWRTSTRLLWVAAMVLPIGAGCLIDDIRIVLPDPKWADLLRQWGSTIGELRKVEDPAVLSRWGGLLLWISPLVLVRLREKGARNGFGWLALFVIGGALTCWQVRWSPYFLLTFLCFLPNLLKSAGTSNRAGLIFCLSLLPLYAAWKERLYPDAHTSEQRYLDRSERLNARLTAERMRSPERLPFIAAWWHSPSLAYWSGQPAVAGSGHEGIEGIVDTARFFMSTNPSEGMDILASRGVKRVVASDTGRVLENSAAILQRQADDKALACKLWDSNLGVDWGLQGETNVTTFRLLRVK